MSYAIQILLVDIDGGVPWIETFPLAPDGEEEPELANLEDEQLTELVLGRVRDYVTHELL